MDMMTITQVAKKLGITERQADYAVRSHGIEVSHRVGIFRLFNAHAVAEIQAALPKGAQKREAVSVR
jgi:hypothetical protein